MKVVAEFKNFSSAPSAKNPGDFVLRLALEVQVSPAMKFELEEQLMRLWPKDVSLTMEPLQRQLKLPGMEDEYEDE